jgi:hypothetical protein
MKNFRSARKQKGAVLVLFVIGMILIIAIAGLALDSSHAYINKTEMQHALDAAALSGAMTLVSGGTCRNATTDAEATFKENVAGTELSGLTPMIELAETLEDDAFGGCPDNPRFVRAKLRGGNEFEMTTWLISVIGKDKLTIGASAVAGPVDVNPCKVGPFLVCGNKEVGCDEDDCYGYKVDNENPKECWIKVGSGNKETPSDGVAAEVCGADTSGWANSEVGPGNYHFKYYESCSSGQGGGQNCMREALSKSANQQCGEANLGYAQSQTGNGASIRKAYNTIFGEYQGGIDRDDYPPDTDTREGIFYDSYDGNNRRVMPVLIAQCDATQQEWADAECGDTNVPYKEWDPDKGVQGRACFPKLTYGCFFLTRKMSKQGNQSFIYGQFIGECPNQGEKTINPNPMFDVSKIILYKDPGSGDS